MAWIQPWRSRPQRRRGGLGGFAKSGADSGDGSIRTRARGSQSNRIVHAYALAMAHLGHGGVVGPLRCVLQKGLGHTRYGVRIGSKKDTRGKATPARALGRGLGREGMPLRQLRRRRAAGRSGRRVGVGWWRWDRAGLRTGPGRRDAPHARWLRELEGAGGEGDVVLKSTPSARRH